MIEYIAVTDLHWSATVLPSDTYWVLGPRILASSFSSGSQVSRAGESARASSRSRSSTSSTLRSTVWLILGRVLTLHSYLPLSRSSALAMIRVQSSALICGLK